MREAAKHPAFRFHSTGPWNGEPPAELLVSDHLTPADRFYVRNHAPVPEVDAGAYRLAVRGRVRRSLDLSLEALQREFPVVEVTATLQCAGNRRRGMMEERPIPGEEPWGIGAIGTARWRGVPLAAVLEAAGVVDGAEHVGFLGLDQVETTSGTEGFGGSIPLAKAQDPSGALLAWEMNAKPLPPTHGAPLRVVVPGFIGARSVKWLREIEVRQTPSDNHFQRAAYKLFPPRVGPDEADWSRGLMLGELSVTSAICLPADGAEVSAGRVTVRGYAMAGGERTVDRVEVSADGGSRWVEAEHEGRGVGEWSLWRIEVELGPGAHELACRAWDSAGETQPENAAEVWNFKGYMNNSWHRIRLRAR